MSATLTLTDIHKSFEVGTVNEHHVLRGVNLTLNEGDFVTVIGGNGAGKSTLLNCIAGNIPVDSGKILLEHMDITNQKTEKRAAHIGRVFQDPRMGTATRLSIEENLSIAYSRGKKRGLSLGVTDSQREEFKKQLVRLDLGLEERLKKEVGLLSGGQRQALTLLMATLVKPKLLLLDEHTAALDPKASQSVLSLTNKMVHEDQLTTLMITHNMEDAIKYGNRLVMLYEGKIVVDINQEQKEGLKVQDLMDLFQKNSGQALTDDALILS
ncbi:ABC transporter ATP-binding protein [Vagococcus teuberi]|uniref:ABC transporter ATP-binding protein n=1 Tax=Vagococcus teuberi TaxID=519472 RepID=A0A1J0A6S4_9ENTE|nr:ABC transporter ATP-binding protein [Vagococcus teuberi]APB31635.1 ABC transporter ATP-binding protein [Vagococcus teuberi]